MYGYGSEYIVGWFLVLEDVSQEKGAFFDYILSLQKHHYFVVFSLSVLPDASLPLLFSIVSYSRKIFLSLFMRPL